jgi:hypothetical protein
VANSFFGVGCFAEAEPVDEDRFNDIIYEAEEAETEETLEPADDEQEEETTLDDDEDWGLCGPKCNKI